MKKKIEIKPIEKRAHWYERRAKFIKEKDRIKENSIIFLGDSITEGYNLNKFFPNYPTVNRGISAEHIDGVIDRLDISLGDAENAKLLILTGINDIGAGRSENAVKHLYKELTDAVLKRKKYEVYLQSILPTSLAYKNCPPEMIININTYIEELARENNLSFINLYPLFLKDNTKYINDKYTTDGMHLNEEGYKIWTEHLNKTVFNK